MPVTSLQTVAQQQEAIVNVVANASLIAPQTAVSRSTSPHTNTHTHTHTHTHAYQLVKLQ